jgi:hypothetical protein
MPPPEVLLAFAIVAVYLFDSALFLSIGEVVVTTGRGVLRGVSFGSGFELGGRRPYLPNPLAPFRPEFRVQWDLTDAPTAEIDAVSSQMQQHLQAIRPIGWLATLSGLLIVIAAPLALLLGEQLAFLLAVAGSALVTLAGCALVIQRRSKLGIGAIQLLAQVFIAVICLPCSANLARAVTLQRRWTLAASDLPLLALDQAGSANARRRVVAALTAAKRYVDEGSQPFQVIDRQLHKLEATEVLGLAAGDS